MLQAANTDLFNPTVPKAHNSECPDQGCQELVTEKGQKPVLRKAKFWILLNKLFEKKAKH